MEFLKFWKKYGEPITGISILLFIIFAWYMIYQDRQLKLEINENCGWGEDDYNCFCEKSEAMLLENRYKELNMDFTDVLKELEDVTLD